MKNETEFTLPDIIYQNDVLISGASVEKIMNLLGQHKQSDIIIDAYNNVLTEYAEGTEDEQDVFLSMTKDLQNTLSRGLLIVEEKND